MKSFFWFIEDRSLCRPILYVIECDHHLARSCLVMYDCTQSNSVTIMNNTGKWLSALKLNWLYKAILILKITHVNPRILSNSARLKNRIFLGHTCARWRHRDKRSLKTEKQGILHILSFLFQKFMIWQKLLYLGITDYITSKHNDG